MKFVFFGGSEFSVHVLNELLLHKIKPDLIVTTPDKPKGRKLIMTPTPVKVWARERNIEVLDPKSLRKDADELLKKLKSTEYDFFLVASYGKIIPADVFDIPERKTLNVHPSMLPKYRGASPIQSQILNDEKEVGVTIMQIDEGMDTGPIIIQKKLDGNNSPISLGRKELERVLAIEGARLISHILPEWLQGSIDPIMQNEKDAIYCEKIEKEDGKIEIELDNLPTGEKARKEFLKIKAFEEWPTAYFFLHEKRIIIIDAKLDENGTLKILKVKPEGKSEMPFEDFMRGRRNVK